MKIYEVIAEGGPVIAGMGSGVDTSTAKGVKKASKPKPQPPAGQKSYHNYMQRGSTMTRQSMTSKQYGKGNVGLT